MIEVIAARRRTILLQGFLNRLVVSGVTPTATQRGALDNLLMGLDAVGLDKFAAVWPFIGGTAATHALDLTGAYDITWAGTVTHDASGVTGDGSTGWGDTGLDPGAAGIVEGNVHLSVYTSAPATKGHQLSMSVGFPTRIDALAVSRSDVSNHYTLIQSLSPFSSVADGGNVLGHFVGVRRDTSNQLLFRNGANIINAAKASTGAVSGRTLGILAQNGSSVGEFSDARLSLASYGHALSDAEVAALYAAVQAFQTTLGRAV